MFYFLISSHCFLCALLIGLVLIQQGKGAELGATLSGASNSLFGAGGAVPFIARLTTGVAIAFMATSILLVRSYGGNGSGAARGVATSPEALLDGSVVGGSVADSSVVNTTKPSDAISPATKPNEVAPTESNVGAATQRETSEAVVTANPEQSNTALPSDPQNNPATALPEGLDKK